MITSLLDPAQMSSLTLFVTTKLVEIGGERQN
jgi:hypothetical protein